MRRATLQKNWNAAQSSINKTYNSVGLPIKANVFYFDENLSFAKFAEEKQIAPAYYVFVFPKNFRSPAVFTAFRTVDIAFHAAKIL